jgi:uncharacterized membrane protein YdbT with pleckstrin-like domain
MEIETEEYVRLRARPHGAALVRPLGRALVLAATGGACIWLGESLHWALEVVGAILLGLAALLALATVWEWDRTDVLLTSDKLLVVWGLLGRRVAEVRLDRDDPIEIEQGVAGRMLGYGTLVAGGLEVPYVPLTRELSGRT